MNILVTGGAGYIGCHAVRALVRKNHQVTVLDDLSAGHRQAVGNVELVRGSTGDKELIKKLCLDHNIEAVMHFAASSLVGESVRSPGDYYRNNVVNGLALLDAVVESKVGFFVFSSTAAVYGEPQNRQITEEHATMPLNPYGATKLALEGALRWYGEAYGLRYTSLRYFNAVGADPEGDIGEDHTPETHLLPLVLKTVLGLHPRLEVFGVDYPTTDGTCVRDYIHVADVAKGHVSAIEYVKNNPGTSVFNLGTGIGTSVLELVRAFERASGVAVSWRMAGRRAGDLPKTYAATEKAKRVLGWVTEKTIEDACADSWRWQSKNPNGYE